MQPMLNIALRAARSAGEFIARATEHIDLIDVEVKGLNDFVTEVDRSAEKIILQELKDKYPDHSYTAEESGTTKGTDKDSGKESEYEWIIDPLDGTTNFIHGFPQFAVSIAVRYQGRMEHAVILDPLRHEEFTASRGRGAQMNGKRLRVSNRKTLEGALIGTGFPFRNDQEAYLDNYLGMLKDVTLKTAGIRRPGAAALDLAYVAAGRLDGFWEIGLQEWDMAAGVLLIQEAGGMVGDINGGSTHLKTGNIVGGNPKVFKGLLQTIRPHIPEKMKR